jgi:hypothetical protein
VIKGQFLLRKPLFFPLNYGTALNRQRIDVLDGDEQVAQRDPQSLVSMVESVVESLVSGEHVCLNRYVG